MKEFLSGFMKDFLSKVLPSSLMVGIMYAILTAGGYLRNVKIGDYDTPKVIREGNLSMFKSAIITNSILLGILIILISITLIAILTLMFKNKEIDYRVKIGIILAVFIIFIIPYFCRNTPYTENDVYDTIESKAEDYITDFTNKEYDKMVKNYILNRNMNKFVSKNIYSQAMER
ncbi:MAG TPA: hypothetical protein PKJ65_01250, partial [Clostridia bacterium]|nr:hypothetical protein [Clostridia bacterium]